MPPKLRTIIESDRFGKERRSLEPNTKRFDEIYRGVTEALARNPMIGRETLNPDIWALPTIQWNTKPFVIYYSFDENDVVLESIIKAQLLD